MNINVTKTAQEVKEEILDFKKFCKDSLICPECHNKFDKINLDLDFKDFQNGKEVYRWCPKCNARWTIMK